MAAGESHLAVTGSEGLVPLPLSSLRKAAILLVAVGGEVASTLFQSLNELDVQRLADEITRMEEVPTAQLIQVMSEFRGLLEARESAARGGSVSALKLLTEAFGQTKADEMLAQLGNVRERTSGDLAMLQKMEPQQLSKFLESEHPQTVALVLAHLDAKRGSTVLMFLSPEMRVEAIRRLAEMRQFSPEMAQKVALTLHQRICSLGQAERKSYEGYKAVTDLLNRLDHSMSGGILDEIEQREPRVATEIRTLMLESEGRMTLKAERDHDLAV